MKKKLAKSQYRFKKQWESIIKSLLVPDNIPLKFAKNITITLESGEVITVTNKKDFKEQLETITEKQIPIADMHIELNYQKLITIVEKQVLELLKN